MDPGSCAWFTKLKRTMAIGNHVFMTHYAPADKPGPPALDCATAGRDFGKSSFRLLKPLTQALDRLGVIRLIEKTRRGIRAAVRRIS